MSQAEKRAEKVEGTDIQREMTGLRNEIKKKIEEEGVRSGKWHYISIIEPGINTLVTAGKISDFGNIPGWAHEAVINGDVTPPGLILETPDLYISGNANFSAGKVENLKGDGSATVNVMRMIGNIAVTGDLKVNKIDTNSNDEVLVMGTVLTGGDAEIGGYASRSITTGGKLIVKGSVHGDIYSGEGVEVGGYVFANIKARRVLVVESVKNNITALENVRVGGSVGGNITSGGSVEVSGFVEGDIHAEKTVLIGKFACGNVEARMVYVMGGINGNVTAGKVVDVTGDVGGDITCGGRVAVKGKADGKVISQNSSVEVGILHGSIKAAIYAKVGEITEDAKIDAPLVFVPKGTVINKANIKGEVHYIDRDKFRDFEPGNDPRVEGLTKPDGLVSGQFQIKSPVRERV